jgi:hypothetical protein
MYAQKGAAGEGAGARSGLFVARIILATICQSVQILSILRKHLLAFDSQGINVYHLDSVYYNFLLLHIYCTVLRILCSYLPNERIFKLYL